MDNARAALQGLPGNVMLIEETGGVFAQIEIGRAYISIGAENPLPELYTKRIRLL